MKSEVISTETIFATALLFFACAEQMEAVPELMASVRQMLSDDYLMRKVQAIVNHLSFDDFLKLCQRSLGQEQQLSLLLNLHDHCGGTEKSSAIGTYILDRFTEALGQSVQDLDEHLAVLQVKQRLWQA